MELDEDNALSDYLTVRKDILRKVDDRLIGFPMEARSPRPRSLRFQSCRFILTGCRNGAFCHFLHGRCRRPPLFRLIDMGIVDEGHQSIEWSCLLGNTRETGSVSLLLEDRSATILFHNQDKEFTIAEFCRHFLHVDQLERSNLVVNGFPFRALSNEEFLDCYNDMLNQQQAIASATQQEAFCRSNLALLAFRAKDLFTVSDFLTMVSGGTPPKRDAVASFEVLCAGFWKKSKNSTAMVKIDDTVIIILSR